MKNHLLYLFISSLIILFSCKKEEPVNNDPFTNGTKFDLVENYNLVVKNDSILVSTYCLDTNTKIEDSRTIEYFGDTTAVITVNRLYPSGSQYTNVQTYYLNAQGLADSVLETHTNSTPSYVYYQYDLNGYLYQTSSNLNNLDGIIYQYVDGNYSPSNGQYEYYPTVAKLDLLSRGRRMDNGITGRDDKNLPKRIRFANFDQLFYYQLNNEGYVTAYIVMDKTDGMIFTTLRTFTYQFIQ